MRLLLVLAESTATPAVKARQFALGGKPRVSIGRDETADWQLPDPIRMVSSTHCEIVQDGTDYFLHDHSTNGTFVNGAPQRIAAPHRLTAGDRIKVGNYLIAVEIPGGEAAATDATVTLRPAPKPAAVPPPAPAPAPPPPAALRGADPAAMVAPAAPVAAPHGGAKVEELTMIAPAPKPAPSAGKPAAKPAAPPPAAEVGAPSGTPPMIAHFARGLGLSEAEIAFVDAVKLAEQAGALLRSLTAGLIPLLAATSAYASPPAAGAPRNPLEDAPDATAALEMLFGPPRRAYLDAERAYKVTLQELLDRAARAAAARSTAPALESFSPAAIEKQFAASGGHAKFLGSKKAALWDFYVSQWAARFP